MEVSLSQSQAATMSVKQECDRLRAALEEYIQCRHLSIQYFPSLSINLSNT